LHQYVTTCTNVYVGLPLVSAVIYQILLYLGAIIIIFLVIKLLKVHDAFDLKYEFIAYAIYKTFLSILYFTPAATPYMKIAYITPLYYCTITFTWPVLRSLIKNIKKPIDLDMKTVLDNNIYFKIYLQYSIQEFSTENVLFYRDHKEFISKMITLDSTEEKERYVMWMYNKYIHENSQLQLNLQAITVKNVIKQMEEKKFDEKIFQKVEDNILTCMEDDSWVRFSRTREFKRLFTEHKELL